jgi:hypothetical protein
MISIILIFVNPRYYRSQPVTRETRVRFPDEEITFFRVLFLKPINNKNTWCLCNALDNILINN